MKKLVFLCLVLFSGMFFGQKKEVLKVNLPKEYEWKVVHNYESDKTDFIIFIPKNENENNWSILVNIMSSKSFITINEDFIKGLFESQSPTKDPLAKLTILGKSKEGEGIWVLFKVETPSFPNDPKPESQLWYVIQGEKTLHSMFIAKKEKTLSKEFIKKWSKVFRSGEFFYEYSDKTQ